MDAVSDCLEHTLVTAHVRSSCPKRMVEVVMERQSQVPLRREDSIAKVCTGYWDLRAERALGNLRPLRPLRRVGDITVLTWMVWEPRPGVVLIAWNLPCRPAWPKAQMPLPVF